jgi:GT2 family glycosyltransferase
MGKDVVPFKGERYPGGGNMALRRSAVEQYGMFNPDLGRTGKKLLAGEEKDLFRRLRAGDGKIYYVPDAQILHIIPISRLTREYFARATRMVGISERIRTRSISSRTYLGRLTIETVKWCGTTIYALGYLLKLQPAKAGGLFILRSNITLGLLGFTPKQ